MSDLAGNTMHGDTHRISVLMRGTETALSDCTVELNAVRSNLTRVRQLRIQAQELSRQAEEIFDTILVNWARARVEMEEIINRYGTQSVSQLLSHQFKSTMEAYDRAGLFCVKQLKIHTRLEKSNWLLSLALNSEFIEAQHYI